MPTPCVQDNCWSFSSPEDLVGLLDGRPVFSESDVPPMEGYWAENRALAKLQEVEDRTGALHRYSDGNLQRRLNELLRDGLTLPSPLGDIDRALEAVFASKSAIARREFTVFRGIKALDGEPSWTFRGYSSCSTSPYSALAFATAAHSNYGQVEIRVPSWAILWITVSPGALAINSTAASKYRGEEEVLLPKQAPLRRLAAPVPLGGGMIYRAIYE